MKQENKINKAENIMKLIRELTDSERINLFGLFSEEFCNSCWDRNPGGGYHGCIDYDSWD